MESQTASNVDHGGESSVGKDPNVLNPNLIAKNTDMETRSNSGITNSALLSLDKNANS